MKQRAKTSVRVGFGAAAAMGAVCLGLIGPAMGLVNPQLQPSHLVDRYKAVVAANVTAIDDDAQTVTVRITHVTQGEFPPKKVTIRVPPPEDDQARSLLDDVRIGEPIVAFVGKPNPRRARDILLYTPGKQWHEAQLDNLQDLSKWTWLTSTFDPVYEEDPLYGTFNGSVGRLRRMMIDTERDTVYFPPYPLARFGDSATLATPGEAAIKGVGLVDIDGDGGLDAFACHPSGNRALLRRADGTYRDATAELGLIGVTSVSCSFADVEGDGRVDLLADGVIYGAGRDGFSRTDRLAAAAAENVKVSAFVELDGDGYPDVVVAHTTGGLTAWRNPGKAGGAFADVTEQMGLAAEKAGSGTAGFFAPGDWDGDGRTDLFFAVDRGILLVQSEKGVFEPVEHGLMFDFTVPGQPDAATGAGTMANLWSDSSRDLVFAKDMTLGLLHNDDGKVRDVTGYGNESQDTRTNQVGTFAADLNVDGTVDLLTLTRKEGSQIVFHTNRGYGSYMLDENYSEEGFPQDAYMTGAWGAAVGDVNGDGANDLLLGGQDGTLRLLINRSLTGRTPTARPTSYEKILQQTRIVAVRPQRDLGMIGAEVQVLDPEGNVVAWRAIGTRVVTGCASALQANIAIRRPGDYTVRVRWSDGARSEKPVKLSPDGPRTVTVEIGK